MHWPVHPLKDILDTENDALVQRILQLALAHGFTDQTSSMRAAWNEAAERLSGCLLQYLTDPRPRQLDGRNDYRHDPRFERLRHIASRHHDAGVPLELHHGLFRLCRRAYDAHVRQLLWQPDGQPTGVLPHPDALLARLHDFFDEADQAMLAPWASPRPNEAALADSIRRLTRERDQYFGVLEGLRGPVFITTEQGELLDANSAALQTFLGLSEPGALRYRLALQHHRPQLQAMLAEILDTGSTELSAIWLDTHAGRRCFDIRLRLVEDSVQKLDRCRIVLMHDVTEHTRAVERARTAERTMSLFLATMSHEIRGPLHSVLGAAELLRDASVRDVERLLDLLSLSAGALNATLENVLGFSRFEHQAPQPRPEPTGLRKALAGLVRTKDILARQRGVPLRLQVEPSLPDEVTLDWSMVQQILGNLIQNALRHDDGRGVLLDVRAQDDQLAFTVSDHGPGLPATVRQQLAQPPATLRPCLDSGQGTGLGLAIAQRMTTALQGTLQPGDHEDGTHLILTLPLVQPARHDTPPERSDTRPRLDCSCLLIDDDPIGALGTVAMLERLVSSTDHVVSLEQASALCAADPDAYDFFIVDLDLPDGSGVAFTRQLRQDPRFDHKPVLLLSANIERIRQRPEDAALFAALIEKPARTAALAQAIEALDTSGGSGISGRHGAGHPPAARFPAPALPAVHTPSPSRLPPSQRPSTQPPSTQPLSPLPTSHLPTSPLPASPLPPPQPAIAPPAIPRSLRLDAASRRLHIKDRTETLSPAETRLLVCLLDHFGQPCSAPASARPSAGGTGSMATAPSTCSSRACAAGCATARSASSPSTAWATPSPRPMTEHVMAPCVLTPVPAGRHADPVGPDAGQAQVSALGGHLSLSSPTQCPPVHNQHPQQK